MVRTRARFVTCLAAISLAAWLAFPAASQAHQIATLSGGVLTITGDQQNKLNDLITIDYDAGSGDFVFGQDVFGPHPAPCRPGVENPQRVIRCPASQIDAIRIQAGAGSDTVNAQLPSRTLLSVSMGSGNDAFQGGSEVDLVDMGPGIDKAYGGARSDRLKGGGGSDKLFGEGGDDNLLGGSAPDKLLGGPGGDQCDSGSGQGKQISC